MNYTITINGIVDKEQSYNLYLLTNDELMKYNYSDTIVLKFAPNLSIPSSHSSYSLFLKNGIDERMIYQLGNVPTSSDYLILKSDGTIDNNYLYNFVIGNNSIFYLLNTELQESSNNDRKENFMACNNTCRYFHYITGVSAAGGYLILSLNDTPELINENNFCFRFNQGIAIPTGSGTLPVYISISGTNYPLWDKYGNVMTGSELIPTTSGATYCPRFTYHGFVGEQTSGGATTEHIIIHNIPRRSCITYFNN